MHSHAYTIDANSKILTRGRSQYVSILQLLARMVALIGALKFSKLASSITKKLTLGTGNGLVRCTVRMKL